MSVDLDTSRIDALKTLAQSLVNQASANGLVLTIEQVPLKPLAMGNYQTIVSVRPVSCQTNWKAHHEELR